MGPIWGPSGADRTQVGSMLAPWTLLGLIPYWNNGVYPTHTMGYRLQTMGLYSLSGKTSYHQILRSLKAMRLDVIMIISLWHSTGIWAARLLRCLTNFRANGEVKTWISWLQVFTRSCSKTSYRLVNRDPVSHGWYDSYMTLIVSYSLPSVYTAWNRNW